VKLRYMLGGLESGAGSHREGVQVIQGGGVFRQKDDGMGQPGNKLRHTGLEVDPLDRFHLAVAYTDGLLVQQLSKCLSVNAYHPSMPAKILMNLVQLALPQVSFCQAIRQFLYLQLKKLDVLFAFFDLVLDCP